jgi:hypothetical protein
MKPNRVLIVTFTVAACFVATEAGAERETDASKPANSPTVEALLALDKRANEGYIKGGVKFFEGLLSETFVMREDGQRMDKAALVKRVAGNKCNVRTWNLDEAWLAKIDTDTYVLSYRATWDGTCTGTDGKPAKIPSPTRAATIWVRSGDNWLAAFHAENPIIDPKNAAKGAVATAQLATQKDVNQTDPSTDALVATEKSIWQAWMAHDAQKMETLTSADLSFIDIFGNSYSNKPDTMKAWAGAICDIKSVGVTDGVVTSLSSTVKLLTHIGTADGTCYGEKISAVYGNSVYVRDGNAWKLAFCMNMPATDSGR